MTAPEIASSPEVESGGNKRDSKLEGLRGYLATGVLVFHVAFMAGVASFLDQPRDIWIVLIDGLSVCLPPFFVLSGLFLYRPFARAILSGTKRPAYGQFLAGRAMRLLPAYFLVLAFALLVINYDLITDVWYVIRPIVLFHFYWPSVPWITGLEPTWTVPAEMLYYITLPLFAWLVHKYARKAADPVQRMRRMMTPLALYFVVGFAWTVYIYLPSEAMTVMTWNLWYWPFGYFDAFAVGMGLAIIAAYREVTGVTPGLHRFVLRRPNVMWLIALVVGILNMPRPFGTLGMGDYPAMRQELVGHVLVLVFAGLIVAPLSVPGVKSRFMEAVLTIPPIRYIGRISYGVYLWHMVVLTLVIGQGNIFGVDPTFSPDMRGTLGGFWELTAYTLAGTVAAASISYYGLELPLMRWRKRRLAAKSAASAPAVSPTPASGPAAEPTPAPAARVQEDEVSTPR